MMLLAPKFSIVVLKEAVSELPTETMAITEAMPIMMPSMVRSERILLDLRPAMASKIFSFINIGFHLQILPLSVYQLRLDNV